MLPSEAVGLDLRGLNVGEAPCPKSPCLESATAGSRSTARSDVDTQYCTVADNISASHGTSYHDEYGDVLFVR